MWFDDKLTFEDGQVSLGGKVLPGILISQTIKGSVQFAEHKMDGCSGMVRRPKGYTNSDISLSFALTTNSDGSCYEHLATIHKIFTDTGEDKLPRVIKCVNPHANARGLYEVLFGGLVSSETDDEDVIICDMHLVENLQPRIKGEKKAAVGDQALNGKPPAASPNSDTTTLTVETKTS